MEEFSVARVSGPVEPAMTPVDWSRAGLAESEVAELASIYFAADEFSLSYLVELWQQWVRELEGGQLWVRDEQLAALDCRDDLDAALPLVPNALRDRVFDLVDELDLRFRAKTVSVAVTENADSSHWWRFRVPIGNAQRLYLFDRVEPDT